jgi:hypothetical protein
VGSEGGDHRQVMAQFTPLTLVILSVLVAVLMAMATLE